MSAAFGPAEPNQGPEFTLALRRMWGAVVGRGNPSIGNAVANGASAAIPGAENAAGVYPAWTDRDPVQLVLNQTGGTAYEATTMFGATVKQYRNPGLKNAISAVNAYTWEGGRGARCEFWRKMSPQVPQ